MNLAEHGAQLHAEVIPPDELAHMQAAADTIANGKAGARVFGGPMANMIANANGALHRVAIDSLGSAAWPVRAILFDKTAEANWSVGWHQDRTIAVRKRCEVAGFGPWSVKDGVPHVEPPIEITAAMVTLRAHLDDCDEDNAPLQVAPGSHRLGRVPSAEIAHAVERLGTARCLARAGDIWAYATAIIHGSDRAHRPRRRRVLQVDYAAQDLPNGLRWLGIASETSEPA